MVKRRRSLRKSDQNGSDPVYNPKEDGDLLALQKQCKLLTEVKYLRIVFGRNLNWNAQYFWLATTAEKSYQTVDTRISRNLPENSSSWLDSKT